MSKKCTPLWREAHFEVKMYKITPCTDHFWKLRCRKSARRCGAKHISKSKCTKSHHVRTTFGGSDVEKSAHRCGAKHISKSKCTKHTMYGPLLEVQMSLRFTTLHYTTLHYTPLHSTTLHYTTLPSTTLRYTKLHYIPLHSTTLRSTTLHYTTLHYTEWHCTTDRQVDR